CDGGDRGDLLEPDQPRMDVVAAMVVIVGHGRHRQQGQEEEKGEQAVRSGVWHRGLLSRWGRGEKLVPWGLPVAGARGRTPSKWRKASFGSVKPLVQRKPGITSRANSSIERRTRSWGRPPKFIQQSTSPTPRRRSSSIFSATVSGAPKATVSATS